MSNPASSTVDMYMNSAMENIYYKLHQEVVAGRLTAEDIEVALWAGWGDGIADGWHDWWCTPDD